MPFDPHMKIEGSEQDLLRTIVYRDVLPKEREPYILAMAGLALRKDDIGVGNEIIDRALGLFSLDETQGYLNPPLPEDLQGAIKQYQLQRLDTRKTARPQQLGYLGVMLIAAAIDHGRSTSPDHARGVFSELAERGTTLG
jgi:hypothetical protein